MVHRWKTEFERGNLHMRNNRYSCQGWCIGCRKAFIQTIRKPPTSNASSALIYFPVTSPWSSSWLVSCVRNELGNKMGHTAKSEKSYHTSEQLNKKAPSGTKTHATRKVVSLLAFKKKVAVLFQICNTTSMNLSYSTKMK